MSPLQGRSEIVGGEGYWLCQLGFCMLQDFSLKFTNFNSFSQLYFCLASEKLPLLPLSAAAPAPSLRNMSTAAAEAAQECGTGCSAA